MCVALTGKRKTAVEMAYCVRLLHCEYNEKFSRDEIITWKSTYAFSGKVLPKSIFLLDLYTLSAEFRFNLDLKLTFSLIL